MSNKIYSTRTTEGDIQHLKHLGLDCPVMLQTTVKGRLMTKKVGHINIPYPLRIEGKLAYALPGGKVVVP